MLWCERRAIILLLWFIFCSTQIPHCVYWKVIWGTVWQQIPVFLPLPPSMRLHLFPICTHTKATTKLKNCWAPRILCSHHVINTLTQAIMGCPLLAITGLSWLCTVIARSNLASHRWGNCRELWMTSHFLYGFLIHKTPLGTDYITLMVFPVEMNCVIGTKKHNWDSSSVPIYWESPRGLKSWF